jgi:addiction module RelE/StbE family toxin
MEIIYSIEAEKDLEEIENFIAKDNVNIAATFTFLLVTSLENILSVFPEAGKNYRNQSFRVLRIAGTKYLAIYDLEDSRIVILRIYHGSRNL